MGKEWEQIADLSVNFDQRGRYLQLRADAKKKNQSHEVLAKWGKSHNTC